MVNICLDLAIPTIKMSIFSKTFKTHSFLICKYLVMDGTWKINKMYLENGREMTISLEHLWNNQKKVTFEITNETKFPIIKLQGVWQEIY